MKGVSTLQIFADCDPNYCGHAAAYSLAYKAKQAGIDAMVYIPQQHGDWNDVLLAPKQAV